LDVSEGTFGSIIRKEASLNCPDAAQKRSTTKLSAQTRRIFREANNQFERVQ